MIKLSANYTTTYHNFVIQNLKECFSDNVHLPTVLVLQNILQRGTPTIISCYLANKLNILNKERKDNSFKGYCLISNIRPNWVNRIKGNEEDNDYPAKDFFENIPKYFPDYCFIQQLLLPETKIDEIIGLNPPSSFNNQSVDFYLPVAQLVIEVDGIQHENQTLLDKERDDYLLGFGIKTIRIKVEDLRKKNNRFKEKLIEIQNRLEDYSDVLKIYKNHCQEFSLIDDEVKKKVLTPTAIIRFQLLILKCLEYGKLSLDDKAWNFAIKNHDISEYEEVAIEDLFIWFENLLELRGLKLKRPRINILYPDDLSEVSSKCLKVDFSLLKRWTDENDYNKDVIYVRTDYIHTYPYKKNSGKVSYEFFSHFCINVSNPIKYKIGDAASVRCLKFLLKNIFDYEEFNSGQLEIITNSLSLRHTIGILPTGSGKSLCYQMCVLLQPAISFVVSPLKSLMKDQVTDLKSDFLIDRVDFLDSGRSIEERNLIQGNYKKGKYFFVIISPERFQIREFRNYISDLRKNFNVLYAVIDEVHCLSEWGHDFRLSYLNLKDTISSYAECVYIGLTATASLKVIEDIKVCLDISKKGVKSCHDFSRPELVFNVIDDNGKKNDALVNLLGQLSINKDNCAIIFTPYASHQSRLLLELMSYRKCKMNIYNSQLEEDEKSKIQDGFKKNVFPLLIATKAFGMGMNKPNIKYTIHYGIPSSMEALYQEAGRAGRGISYKKGEEKAYNYVLLSKEVKDVSSIFNKNTSYSEINSMQKRLHFDRSAKDVCSQIFLWLKSNQSIEIEFSNVVSLFKKVIHENGDIIIEHYGDNKADKEKHIYYLKVLGVVKDWLVDYNARQFEIEKTKDYDFKSNLMNYIHKWDNGFNYTNYDVDIENSGIIVNDENEKCIYILLRWTYDNISYTRRESLKNLYELCSNFDNPEEFKKVLESYFAFGDDAYDIQKIIEGGVANYEFWFDILMDQESLLNIEELNDIKTKLMRFLESYSNNIPLNFISGLLRLALDDYDNLDGRTRLEDSLKEICSNNPEISRKLLYKLLELGVLMEEKNKNELTETLVKYYSEHIDLLTINDYLGTELPLAIYLNELNNKMITINNNIYEKITAKYGENSR
jgi:ATP-dependent DNA helicase RecQ